MFKKTLVKKWKKPQLLKIALNGEKIDPKVFYLKCLTKFFGLVLFTSTQGYAVAHAPPRHPCARSCSQALHSPKSLIQNFGIADNYIQNQSFQRQFHSFQYKLRNSLKSLSKQKSFKINSSKNVLETSCDCVVRQYTLCIFKNIYARNFGALHLRCKLAI